MVFKWSLFVHDLSRYKRGDGLLHPEPWGKASQQRLVLELSLKMCKLETSSEQDGKSIPGKRTRKTSKAWKREGGGCVGEVKRGMYA